MLPDWPGIHPRPQPKLKFSDFDAIETREGRRLMGLRWSGGTLQAGRLRRLSNGQHPTGASSLTCPGSALAAYLARMHGLTGLRVRQDQWSFNWSTTCNQKWWQRGGSETGTWHSVDHDMRRCEGRHAGHVTRKSMMPWCRAVRQMQHIAEKAQP